METLSSSEQALIESGRDTERFEYTHEYSLDNGVTWKKVEPGEDLLELIGKGVKKIRAIPSVKQMNLIGEYEVDEVEDFTPSNVVVPQSDPNEPLPYEIYDARVNSDGMLEKVSDAEDYKVLSCGFGSSGYSPGGVSWIPATASQERKAKWRKRFRMKGRKNV